MLQSALMSPIFDSLCAVSSCTSTHRIPGGASLRFDVGVPVPLTRTLDSSRALLTPHRIADASTNQVIASPIAEAISDQKTNGAIAFAISISISSPDFQRLNCAPTGFGVERLVEGASFNLDAWEMVPTEYRAWRKAEKRADRLAKALDSVPSAHWAGAAFQAVCERLDQLIDEAIDLERKARAAFRLVVA